jgi:hypothetical protein
VAKADYLDGPRYAGQHGGPKPQPESMNAGLMTYAVGVASGVAARSAASSASISS